MTKLIVGLGNPDPEYAQTRHNIGFTAIDMIAKKSDANSFEFDKKINAFVTKGKLEKSTVILAKPQTYVNKSGEAIKKLSLKNKIKPQNIIVLHDDLDIPFGNTKLSFDKPSAGHRGVQSVINHLKTKKFYRLRIGTQTRSLINAKRKNPRKKDDVVVKFVLGKFTPKERTVLRKVFREAFEKIQQLL